MVNAQLTVQSGLVAGGIGAEAVTVIADAEVDLPYDPEIGTEPYDPEF